MLDPDHDAMMTMISTAEAMARRFRLPGPVATVQRLGSGHIHDSFLVTTSGPAAPGHVLQRINERVFPDVTRLTAVVTRVTTHLGRRAAGRPDPGRRALTVVESVDGGATARDDEGRWWRAFVQVAGARTHPEVHEPAVASQIATTAARFLVDMADAPGPPLAEAIPGFHDMVARLHAFEAAVDAAEPGERAACAGEIDAVRARASVVDELVAGRRAGALPERTVHNDAKADNVMVDERTGEGLCMIDLDTVGPGSVLFDFGDLVRSMAAGRAEDAGDAGGGPTRLRTDLLEAVATGYLGTAGCVLAPGEVDRLALGGPLMTWEAALRFLADHLAGDVYYRVDRRGHNLDRAQAQLRLLDALVAARAWMSDIVGAAALRAAEG